MANEVHNLDDGVSEYFEFILKGHLYRFRYLTTDEIDALSKIDQNDEDVKKFLYQFITKVEKDSPEFIEIVGSMTIPHWVRFRDMLSKEMTPHDSSKSTKTTS